MTTSSAASLGSCGRKATCPGVVAEGVEVGEGVEERGWKKGGGGGAGRRRARKGVEGGRPERWVERMERRWEGKEGWEGRGEDEMERKGWGGERVR